MLSGSTILDLASSIAKPFFNYGIGYFYAEKHKKHFIKISSQELEKINNCSSLDSGDFFKFVNSSAFQELLSSNCIL